MPRAPSYTPQQEVEVSTLARAGKTIQEIMEATGLSQGVIQGIKKKAGLVSPRGMGPRKAGVSRARAKGDGGSQLGFLDLEAFVPSEPEEAEEDSAKMELILQLREEQNNIERELISTARKVAALERAKAWWQLRILRVSSGEEDPGSVPPDDWTGEGPSGKAHEVEEPAPKKKGSRKR